MQNWIDEIEARHRDGEGMNLAGVIMRDEAIDRLLALARAVEEYQNAYEASYAIDKGETAILYNRAKWRALVNMFNKLEG